MLTMFRKMLRSKAAGLLFALVIISMAVWGVEDIFSGPGGNLIKAGERSITVQEFDAQIQDQLRDLSRQQGRAVTKAEAVESGLVDQLFQQEANVLVVLGYGESIGARASTQAVMNEVLQQEAFNNALSGDFDAEVYESVLRRNNLNPREFEQNIRDGLTRSYVISAAGAAIDPPKSFADLQALYEAETRSVSILSITSEDVSDLPDPTEEELRAYFEENIAGFGEPERRGITVLHFSPSDFRQSVEITDEMLVTAYEAGKLQRYSTPQTRRYLEAYFATEAAALQALGVLAAGGQPDALENIVSIEVKTNQQADLSETSYSNQLFSIAEGAVTEPFVVQDQWVVSRIEEIIPGDPYPFETVRDQIKATLITENAQSAFDEAARSLEDLKGEGLNLQEIGERIGAPAISYLPVDRRGNTASRATMLSLIATYPQALEAAQSLFEGRMTDRFDLEDGGIYLAQLDTIVAPSTPPFEDVKDRVLTAWRITNSGEAVARFSEELAQKINRGDTTLIAEARSLGKQVNQPAATLRRSDPSSELPPSAIASVFTAKQVGTAIATPTQSRNEFLIISVDAISPPSLEAIDAIGAGLRSDLSLGLDRDLESALAFEIFNAVDLTTNDNAYAAYKARNTAQ